MSRILALDLDDTLLCTDKSVSADTLAWLARWQADGRSCVVATGRPPRSVPMVLPDLLLAAPRIVYNGAQIWVDGHLIYRNEIAPADVRFVVEWSRACAPHWCVGLEIDDQLYLNRATNKPGHYVVTNLDVLADQPAAKIIFLFPEQREDVSPLLAVLPPTMRALVTPKFQMVQLCAGTADKASALAVLLAQWGCTFADVVAIGDDVNDIELVHAASLGVAVANAIPAVKAVANWLAPSNDEGGVAWTIARLLTVGQR
jgi:Cof subfamily protein (haloacid dehalogenase superfamily)